MKRCILNTLGLAALAVLPASCQLEERGANVTGEVDFTINAGIPAGLTTYADPESAFSHQGGANNVNAEKYDLRYKLKVYDADAVVYEDEEIVKDDFARTPVKFSARLLAKKYEVVLWADFVKEVQGDVQASDLYYNTDDFSNISYTTEVSLHPEVLASDAVDAYYSKFEMNLTEAGQSMKDIKLYRPFGKVRFIATDVLTNPDGQTERPQSVKMDFQGAQVPGGFNAITGEALAVRREINVLTSGAVEEKASVNGAERTGYLLGYAYFFATDPASAHEVNVTVYSDESKTNQIGYRELSGIPVSENKLTTVIGNFYTNEGSLEVVVEDLFGNGEGVENVPETVVTSSLSEAQQKLDEMAGAAGMDGKLDPVVFRVTKTAAEQDAESFSLPAQATDVTLVLEQGATKKVTVNQKSGETFNGTLKVENRNTENGNDLVVNTPSASAEIAGKYNNVEATTAANTLVIAEGTEVETLKVNGGNVKIFGTVNPDNITIAEGVNSKIYWGAGTEERLRAVLGYDAAKNHGVILTGDIVCESLDVNNGAQANQDGFKIGGSNINGSNEFVENPYDGYLFDGNGHSLSGAAYNNIMAVYANGVTVKNLEIFQAAEPEKANAGISIYRVNGVVLENVNVHHCGKAGVIVNASQVSAKSLLTEGNAWGAVNVSKGGAPSGGPRPEFTFDASSRYNEAIKVYVDLGRTGEDYVVNAPEGWKSYKLGNTEFYVPADGKNVIPAGTDLSQAGLLAANTVYYLQAGEYASSILIDQEGVQLIGEGSASDVIVNNSIFVKAGNVIVKNMTVIPKSNDGIYTENQNDITFTVEDVTVDMKERPSGTAVRVSDAAGVTLNVAGCNLIIPKNSMRGVNFYDLTDGKCVLNMDRTHIGPKAEVMGIGYYTDEQNSVFTGLYDTRGIGLGAGGTEMEMNITDSVIEGVYYAVNIIPAATATVKFNMDRSTLDGRCAFNIWARNENNVNEYVVKNSNLVGRNPFGGPTEEFATIVFNFGMGGGFSEPKNNHIVIENSGIYCYNNPETDKNTQYAADMRSWDSNTLELKGNTVIYDRSNSSRLEYAVVVNSDNTCNVDETVKFLDKDGKVKDKPIVHYN